MYAPLIKSVDDASFQLILRHLFVRGFNVYSIIWRYFESLKEGVFYFIKYMTWAVASCSNSLMHVCFHIL